MRHRRRYQTRTIEGIATAEVLDKQGEIVDYETTKAVMQETWPGNFREMHKAEAVGNGSIVSFDDIAKTITWDANHGKPVERDIIDKLTGYKRSSRDAYLSRLTARRLVESVGRGEVRASAELFS